MALAEFERLQRPSATWSGGVVIPVAPFRRLAPDVRLAIAQEIRNAVEGNGGSPPRGEQ